MGLCAPGAELKSCLCKNGQDPGQERAVGWAFPPPHRVSVGGLMEGEADGELVKAAGFSQSPRRRAGGCSTAGNQTDQKIQLEMEREVRGSRLLQTDPERKRG